MKILGISAHYHDSAAALVIDGLPVAVVQEERLSRRKNDAVFPLLAIEWCLTHAGVQPEALDAVVFYERPMLKFDRILTSTLRAFPRSWRAFPKAMKNALGEKVWVRGLIASQLGVPNAFDPAANVDGGAKYLRELLERYNFDLVKALAAYNAGSGAVSRNRGIPPYRETRDYVKKITDLYWSSGFKTHVQETRDPEGHRVFTNND